MHNGTIFFLDFNLEIKKKNCFFVLPEGGDLKQNGYTPGTRCTCVSVCGEIIVLKLFTSIKICKNRNCMNELFFHHIRLKNI